MNDARHRTADNTLLMRIGSNLYIKMTAPGWPFSCNTGIKVFSTELTSQPGLCDQALTVSCTVRLLLSGHPRDFEKWLLNGGWPPNRGQTVLSRSLHVKPLEFRAFVVHV